MGLPCKDRLWQVVSRDWFCSTDVYATSRKEAVALAKDLRDEPKAKAVAHLWDCDCEDLYEPCVKAAMESKLKGTRLGALCGL